MCRRLFVKVVCKERVSPNADDQHIVGYVIRCVASQGRRAVVTTFGLVAGRTFDLYHAVMFVGFAFRDTGAHFIAGLHTCTAHGCRCL